MRSTTLLALVAAATLGYAGDTDESPAPPSYYTDTDAAPPSYDGDNGGGNGGGHGHFYFGGGGGGGGGWPGRRSGRFAGHHWGGSGDDDDNGGDWYGSCDTCRPPPKGIAMPPKHVRFPTNPNDFPPESPFRKNFQKIANSCSSVNNVDSGVDGSGGGNHKATCCVKDHTQDGGDTNAASGLLGGILNSVVSNGPTCTLDIASSICKSGSVTCCPTENHGDVDSLVNIQSVCVPVNIGG